MEPDEKKLAVSIFESHEKTFSIPCVKELMSKSHVPMPEMQNVRVAIELAIKDPSHLERGKPDISAVLEQPVEVQEAQAKVTSVMTGLRSLELHPKAADGTPLLIGIAHFNHLCSLARRSVPTGKDLVPSSKLDVEYTKTQQRLINPRPIDYVMHEIAKCAHGEYAKQAMAKRKLDNLGYARGECGLSNDPERMARLQNQLHLVVSIASISKEAADNKAANASVETAKLIEAAPAALAKLTAKGGDLGLITKADMAAIAFKHFKGTILKGDKASHVKELSQLIEQQPGVLPAPPPIAPPPIAPTLALGVPC